jgi:hypothetical protein
MNQARTPRIFDELFIFISTGKCRMLKADVYRLRYIGCSTPRQARNQSASNLNRIFPLRLDFKERSIACLNWSRG